MPLHSLQKKMTKLLHGRYLLSLREAFIALIPYFVSSALAILALNSALTFNLVSKDSQIAHVVSHSAQIILLFFPVVVSISIGFFLTKNYAQSGIVGALLAVLCFAVHGEFLQLNKGEFTLSSTSTAYAIILPSISSLLFIYLMRTLPQPRRQFSALSRFLREKFLVILPFTLVFFSFYVWTPLLGDLGHLISLWLAPDISQASVAELTFQRMMASHTFWFFGVHGDNTFSMLFEEPFLAENVVANLSAKTFYDTFVLIGGTGCFAGLIVASFWLKKGTHERNVAQLSIPFTAFNFCEIILFALPIFLNPVLLIPFILAPAINFFIAFNVLEWGWVNTNNLEISWMTPTLISGYQVSGGISGVILQLMLLIVNACIYYPFLKWHSEQIHYQKALNQLSEQLNISEQLRSASESQFIQTQRAKERSSKALNKVLEELAQGQLLLYYQPQISQVTGGIVGYEALLRLRKSDGTIVGPYFIDVLVKHGQTSIIDSWVIEQAAADLEHFASQEYWPVISINVNPTLISDDKSVLYICDRFKDFPKQLKIEVVESSYFNDKSSVITNINRLKQHEIATVIDDFGTGYSSLSMLADLPIEQVKLDKAFLDKVATEQGREFYSAVVQLLHQMNKQLVAEGVESQPQLNFVKGLKIEVVQGWYYEKAIPKEHVLNYFNDFKIV
ncbi:PTS sugar transporter subunit IIC/EAL domain-containing protein [Pseudoalteromonas sp. MMG005]|nr:PTS sugar transporter subunit IIC/EAL domain-containing protein [Pseudoalteromonas sp. MMG005]